MYSLRSNNWIFVYIPDDFHALNVGNNKYKSQKE